MDTSMRRRYIGQVIGPCQEVASDGRTVWVNIDGRCVARFCPLSQEYGETKDFSSLVQTHHWQNVDHASMDWLRFAAEVEHRFAVTIAPKHRPLYARPSHRNQAARSET